MDAIDMDGTDYYSTGCPVIAKGISEVCENSFHDKFDHWAMQAKEEQALAQASSPSEHSQFAAEERFVTSETELTIDESCTTPEDRLKQMGIKLSVQTDKYWTRWVIKTIHWKNT